MYRRRLWITLILADPVVVYSELIQDWFGFTAPQVSVRGDEAEEAWRIVTPVLDGWARSSARMLGSSPRGSQSAAASRPRTISS